jgi:hypothetical protein
MTEPSYDSLPAGHSLRVYCERWEITDPDAQQDLVRLLRSAVNHVVRQMFTGEFRMDV